MKAAMSKEKRVIIDVHYHLMPVVNEEIAARTAKYAIRAAEIMGKPVDAEAIIKKALETWADPTGERLISLMDDSGIDVTVIWVSATTGN